MGVDKFYTLPLKRGLLKRIFEDEQRKQYINSSLHPCTGVKRCSGSDCESSLEFRIEPVEESDRNCTQIHRFRVVPHKRVVIVDDGSRYRYNDRDREAERVCAYFDGILKELCGNRVDWTHKTRLHPDWMNEDDVETEAGGDELDDVDLAAELPRDVRTPEENAKVIARYGPEQAEEADTLEAAVFGDDLTTLKSKLDTGVPPTQPLLHAAVEKRNTAAAETIIEHGAVPDDRAFDIALATYDDHTVYLLLDKGGMPNAKHVALAGVGWLQEGKDDQFFLRMLATRAKAELGDTVLENK